EPAPAPWEPIVETPRPRPSTTPAPSPAPAPSWSPTAPEPEPEPGPEPQPEPAPVVAVEPVALDVVDDRRPSAPVEKAAAPTKRAAKKAAKNAARKAAKKAAAPPTPFVDPDAGACPSSHPVKVKLSSKLFHLPGMFAYDRTKADRCYVDAFAAEADGFTRARR
ncbi:MAG TPA: hypothetical protein VFV35_04855, partial [Acidimicrobiales bacterium]|nr:hypothetical protein [Acidimicrobiales bacterium]